jgi:hypothetical protein
MNRTGAVALIFITGVAILGAGRLRTAVTPAAAQAPAAGQFAPYRAPRLSGTNEPNLNGIWRGFDLGLRTSP